MSVQSRKGFAGSVSSVFCVGARGGKRSACPTDGSQNRAHRARLQRGDAPSPRLRRDSLLGAARGPYMFLDRKSTRLNSSHTVISYAVFCLKKKKDAIPGAHPALVP